MTAIEVAVNEDEWSPLEPTEVKTGNAGAWEYTWLLPDDVGNYTIRVRAKDSAGQYSVEDSITVHVVTSEEVRVVHEPETAWGPVVGALTALVIILAVSLTYLLLRRRK